MTVVACWISGETNPPQIWAVSDSRVTTQAGVLSDSVAKLFSVPIVCRRPGPSGFFDEIYFSSSLGVAVAGHAILSLNLYAILVPILSNLIANPGRSGDIGAAIPSIADIAALTARLHKVLSRQIGVTVGDKALSEALVFGFCHRVERNRIFRLTPFTNLEANPPLDVAVEEQDTSSRDFVALLGTNQADVMQRINDQRANAANNISWWRAPERVLRELIESRTYASVGGAIQMSLVAQWGANVFARAEPIVRGAPAATIRYLGMDLRDDIGTVGPCSIGMLAMA